jgi:hypothetical protein
MTTTRTPANSCPTCGKFLDAMSRMVDDDARPRPGDVTVCIGCAAVLVIKHDLTVRLPTPGELDDMATDQELLRTREAIQFINAREAARLSSPRVRSRRRRR